MVPVPRPTREQRGYYQKPYGRFDGPGATLRAGA